MKCIASVDTLTSLVVHVWNGGDEQSLPVVAGRQQITVDDATEVRTGFIFDGNELKPPIDVEDVSVDR